MASISIHQLNTAENGLTDRDASITIAQNISHLVRKFQKKEGEWITRNCQYIQMDEVNYYGIHKNSQLQATNEETRKLYQKLKSHVVQKMKLPPTTEFIQVIGGCTAFTREGTDRAKKFLIAHFSQTTHAISYGYTGLNEDNGTRCDVNAAVSDVVFTLGIQDRTVANVVGYHTPLALNTWGSSGPPLKHFIIVYGDDESCSEKGTVFGDDVITSDFFADRLLLLDGGIQSFRQTCTALLLDQKIIALSGFRTEKSDFIEEASDHSQGTVKTHYFAAVQFLKDVTAALKDTTSTNHDAHLNQWFERYFGKGKCYICRPNKGTIDTKQKLLHEAWKLFVDKKLYLKIDSLITFQ